MVSTRKPFGRSSMHMYSVKLGHFDMSHVLKPKFKHKGKHVVLSIRSSTTTTFIKRAYKNKRNGYSELKDPAYNMPKAICEEIII